MAFVSIFRSKLPGLISVALLYSPVLLSQPGQDRSAQITAALRDQQYEQALQILRGQLRQYPGSAELWTMQGVAYNGLGEKKEALVAFRHALKLAPDTIPALQGAAQIEYDNGSASAIPI